jgi:acyl-CoA-binding protein
LTLQKVFCLTFLRDAPGKQVADDFTESLCKGAHVTTADVARLVESFPAVVQKGSVMRFGVRPQAGGQVVVSIDGSCKELPLMPALCEGLNTIYLGPERIVKGLAASLEQRLSALGAEAGSIKSVPSVASPFGSPWEENGDNDADDASNTDEPAPLPPIDEKAAEVPPPQASSWAPGDQRFGQNQTLPRSRSWKEKAGRQDGGDNYRFGDVTRRFMNKARRNNSSGDVGSPGSSVSWSPGQLAYFAPLTWQGRDGETPWVTLSDVPALTESTLSSQQLRGYLYKHHGTNGSIARGILIPQWSSRHFELAAGTVRYRKTASGPVRATVKLDGARVVAESSKQSPGGECFVFQVMVGPVCHLRLSCADKGTAQAWVKQIAAVCSFYQREKGLLDPLASTSAPSDEAALISRSLNTPRDESDQADTTGPTALLQRFEDVSQAQVVERIDALSAEAPPEAPDMQTRFESAVAHVSKGSKALDQGDNEQKLGFYKFYKQATTGKCRDHGGAQPWMSQVERRAKWDAWNSLGDMSAEEAKLAYVHHLGTVDPAWKPVAMLANGTSQSVQSGQVDGASEAAHMQSSCLQPAPIPTETIEHPAEALGLKPTRSSATEPQAETESLSERQPNLGQLVAESLIAESTSEQRPIDKDPCASSQGDTKSAIAIQSSTLTVIWNALRSNLHVLVFLGIMSFYLRRRQTVRQRARKLLGLDSLRAP